VSSYLLILFYILFIFNNNIRSILIYLLAFLRRVSEHSEVNMMALHNLATVFAPNLLRKADSNALGMVVDTPLINSCFNILLRDFDYVFGVSNPYSLLFIVFLRSLSFAKN